MSAENGGVESMERYQALELEILEFEAADVITESDPTTPEENF